MPCKVLFFHYFLCLELQLFNFNSLYCDRFYTNLSLFKVFEYFVFFKVFLAFIQNEVKKKMFIISSL